MVGGRSGWVKRRAARGGGGQALGVAPPAGAYGGRRGVHVISC
jgi:hypothetical protein